MGEVQPDWGTADTLCGFTRSTGADHASAGVTGSLPADVLRKVLCQVLATAYAGRLEPQGFPVKRRESYLHQLIRCSLVSRSWQAAVLEIDLPSPAMNFLPAEMLASKLVCAIMAGVLDLEIYAVATDPISRHAGVCSQTACRAYSA